MKFSFILNKLCYKYPTVQDILCKLNKPTTHLIVTLCLSTMVDIICSFEEVFEALNCYFLPEQTDEGPRNHNKYGRQKQNSVYADSQVYRG